MTAVADTAGVAYEVMAWKPAPAHLPDSDTTVLCWLATGEWQPGWWDDAQQIWLDAATGGQMPGVTHWAEPEGPEC